MNEITIEYLFISSLASGTISAVSVKIKFATSEILSGADYEVGCYLTQDIAKPITYKWKLNSEDIPGETNTLIVTAGDIAGMIIDYHYFIFYVKLTKLITK